MEGETISVIIPAYNVAPWLPRCLDSILAQTYPKLEIIVVDDGSADNTRQVMEDYAARDGRIRHGRQGGHELLTMKAHCAVAALAGMEPDGGDVDKIGLCCHTGPPVFSSKRAGPRGSGSLCCRF